ncbi:uncharacterized protein LOC117651557 [Thrips palmi]|uniref:Uncharacterized protein LOC117651557 n=1 Tax=Thrips palmi TaxID=161013 RepID=A0A6P9A1A6_THRPL|nr:uncharacterized protein LOC117651557 [Thrips palmi]XP_034251559.1 uncharacterized protein LOC117651557 [Thrips palmi]XP_034251560.1 uncharacterized protein LOC117651557 [Thrips palmi]
MRYGSSTCLWSCLWPCLLASLSSARLGTAATIPDPADAPQGLARDSLRTKPSCQIMIGNSIVRSCGYIEHSDACCMGPLSTKPISSTQRHLAEGPAHSNVTFTTLYGDGLYFLSHDEGCGSDHECWEVSLGRLGQLGSALDTTSDGMVEVLVSFMAGPKVYNVSLSTVTTSRASKDGAAQSGPECKMLRASTPVLDISGQDATLRLVPPQGGMPSNMPAVCVTFHSDQCRVDCKDFAVPTECKRSRFHQSVHCVEKPFDSVLTIRNVTKFQPDIDHADLVNTANKDYPLQFHCARLQLGGCVLATPTIAVRMSSSSEPAEVSVVAYGARWATPLRSLLLVTIPLCLAVLLLCVVHNFCSGSTSIGWRQYPQLPLHFRSEDHAVVRPAAAAAPPPPEPSRRIILVYCKPSGDDDCDGHVLSGALRALGRILSAGGKTEVIDMYDDPCLLEDGAVMRASDILNDADAVLVVVLTPLLAETLRPSRGSRSALDMDPFQKFITTLALGLSHVPQRAAKRVFPVSLDARQQPDFLIGVPITAVYVMPYHLMDLLRAIPGVSEDASSYAKFQAEEQKLKMYTRMYSELKPGGDSVDSV